MRLSSISELRELLKHGHAKIRDSVQLPASAIQPSISDAFKKPYEDEAFDSRIILTVHSFRNGCDPDGPIIKWTLDAIVESGLLANDTTKEIAEIRYLQTEISKSEEERTVFTLEEVE